MKLDSLTIALTLLLTITSCTWLESGKELRAAVVKDDIAAVKTLASSAAAANSANSDGITPLMLAAAQGSLPIASALLSVGADPNLKAGKTGITALMFSASFGHIDVARVLVEKGADLNAKDAREYTARDYTLSQTHRDSQRAVAMRDFFVLKHAEAKLDSPNILAVAMMMNSAKPEMDEILAKAKTP